MTQFLDLEKFKLQSKIGQGSFGQVYKVIEKSTENVFAAKISISIIENNKKLFMNLRREVSILSQLNHPSILKFIGYSPFDFNHKPYPVIVTEYSSNGSLEDIIKLERRSTSPERWTDTKKLINVYGISLAMSYLHSHNIIHRDLKPANILEDDNLYPRIADFGLSKICHQNYDSMTAQSTVGLKGTLIYTAPEIWSSCEYTKAGDVYSFSLIFYELFTNEEPFKNFDYNLLYSKVIINNERPEFKYPIPDCYKNLIERCWSPNPENRPTFEEIAEEIRTNNEFIIDTIDESEFIDYVESIDESCNQFDDDKTIGITIVDNQSKKADEMPNEKTDEYNSKSSGKNQCKEAYDDIDDEKSSEEISEEETKEDSKENEKVSEKETDQDLGENEKVSSEEKDININITVREFNKQPFKMQRETINRIIKSKKIENKKEQLNNINKLFQILIEKEANQEHQYIHIRSKTPSTTILETIQNKTKIILTRNFIEILEEYLTSRNNYIIECLGCIDNTTIEIKYPSQKFERIYNEILLIEANIKERIRISIQINEMNQMTKTDMRFRNDTHIYSLSIGKNITEISGDKIGFKNYGGGSFCGCSSLKHITIPSSVKSLCDYSLCGCSSLKHIIIPSSVASIGEGCFSGCTSLTQIQIPSSITTIKKNTFFGCTSLTQITFSTPSSVVKIEEYAFYECTSLAQIFIPSTVTEIGDFAFSKCLIQRNVLFPSSVTQIGKRIFDKCNNISFINGTTQIHPYIFHSSSLLTQITIPSSVTIIGKESFAYCKSLKQITIPSSVNKICSCSFHICESLNQVTFESPSSLTSISKFAFSGCNLLEKITIPPSVNKISKFAFDLCKSLTHFTIPSSVSLISRGIFNNCESLKQITIPSSVNIIGEAAFNRCMRLEQISFEIPSSVAVIENEAFCCCYSLKQITIPSSVTHIGKEAFKDCISLTEVIIPSSVTQICENAFEGCLNVIINTE